jgi:hypothetical protein
MITSDEDNRRSSISRESAQLPEAEGHDRVRGTHRVKKVSSDDRDIRLQRDDSSNSFLKR